MTPQGFGNVGDNVGGIDFNPNNITLNVQDEGLSVDMGAWELTEEFAGLVPVVVDEE